MYGMGYLWWLVLFVNLPKPWCQVVWANISLNIVKVIFICDEHLNLVDSVKEIILHKVGGTHYEKTYRLRSHKEEGSLPWDCLQTQDQNINSCQNFQDACLSACPVDFGLASCLQMSRLLKIYLSIFPLGFVSLICPLETSEKT